MARREPSSASSSRPRTSSNRPTTSGGYYSQDTGYTYSNDYSFDEEEESEEEDVFAFVPPTTADQRVEQSILQSSPHHALSSTSQGLHIAFPPPVYDAHASSSHSSSNLTGVLALHHLNHHPSPQIPIETPPSTDSQRTDDPYRLRRVVTTTPSTHDASRNSEIGSRGESRQLHLSLSTTSKRTQEEPSYDITGKEPAPSTLASSRSAVDDDSRTESIK